MHDDDVKRLNTALQIAEDVVPAIKIARYGAELVFGKLSEVEQRRRDRAYQVYLEAWAFASGKGFEEADEHVRKLLQEGDSEDEDRLYESFRNMMSARNSASWPYIARMTAIHELEGMSHEFFIRCGRFLKDCEGNDLSMTSALLQTASKKWDRDHAIGISTSSVRAADDAELFSNGRIVALIKTNQYKTSPMMYVESIIHHRLGIRHTRPKKSRATAALFHPNYLELMMRIFGIESTTTPRPPDR
ncbi:MAG: hypothetical protein AAFV53_42025 [Myxococcota bacterium]